MPEDAAKKLTLAIRPNPKVLVNILHEDRDFLIIDKPPGLVTQPGKGHAADSLLNGLFALKSQALGKQLHNLGPRRDFGLLHRLDRETSGLLVIAKSPNGYDQLRRDFEARKIDKEYLALVAGIPRPLQGVVQARLKEVEVPNESASYKAASIKKSVISRQGQEAITAYRTLSHVESTPDSGPASLLKLTIKTGRLHQIRAHMLFLNCEVLGDDIYHAPNITAADYPHPPRLCLHAGHLGFRHPVTAKWLHFYSPLPPDLARYAGKLHLDLDQAAWTPAAPKTH